MRSALHRPSGMSGSPQMLRSMHSHMHMHAHARSCTHARARTLAHTRTHTPAHPTTLTCVHATHARMHAGLIDILVYTDSMDAVPEEWCARVLGRALARRHCAPLLNARPVLTPSLPRLSAAPELRTAHRHAWRARSRPSATSLLSPRRERPPLARAPLLPPRTRCCHAAAQGGQRPSQHRQRGDGGAAGLQHQGARRVGG